MNIQISPSILLLVVAAYSALLFLIAKITSKNSTNLDFFNGSRQSPWPIVAFGMIGATLSGVTFISIPGIVKTTQFSYLQMVIGYGIGYAVIAYVLLPLYYRKNLISIYGYLQQRFDRKTQITGSAFFILSRLIGASFRLYLMAMVLQDFILVHFGISFWQTVLISLVLIWLYTAKAGIKTIVWTDTLQTFFMILAVVVAIFTITSVMNQSLVDMFSVVKNSDLSKTFFFENGWQDKNNFIKQVLAGALIAIVMTGLDQDMMQKNISCKTLKESQKNIKLFYVILVLVNILFLFLGALLYLYANQSGVALPEQTDKVFPFLAFNSMPAYFGIIFLVGLLAAAYSSADSALTSLTTSYCLDILNNENTSKTTRMLIHFGFSTLLFLIILVFRYFLESSAITGLFTLAGYTYGPLLGLFAFGILSKKQINNNYVPILAIFAPVITFFLNKYSKELFFGYSFGFELLLINGMIMFFGLFLLTKKPTDKTLPAF
ncbi:MAG TPA: sodium:solute symporter [Gammaproteobacteria bacterium]|nr:sodium:solute symporter [Xanthomonadales bacterium]MCB1593347.1 sodium:solute symporter [Xanthomonadales bacterium]HOP22124.1 sodium:solute symporter [Gammaproteobacteria bacterium]HPI94614.1 sodium:solute symporter [Gammaproteobacteria bacterium]HPQ86059.1 sodium:solute symporter [Gammaproteobacteria bacterium]